MNITRYNYEALFLLYVDKELSAADRKAVDVFVQENPDLQMELSLLQQTVVSADEVVLQKKDWLYMEEDITALQENLLLYADDELSAVEKNAVECLLDTNATARAELNVLQQTKLQPDMAVVFEDKALLYRKQEGGKVIGFKWWKVAAAAVLLSLGLWTGVLVYKNNLQKTNGFEELVKENERKSGQETTVTPVNDAKQIISTPVNAVAETSTAGTNQQTITQSGEKAATASEKIDKSDRQKSAASYQTITQQNSNSKKPDNNLPKQYSENIDNKPGNETTVNTVQSENNNNVRVSGNNDVVVKMNPKEDITNSKMDAGLTAIQAGNTNTDSGENNSSYLNVDDSKEKRTALGGFIRKAKRVLERTANVKIGEGFKIAGFEIALK